MTAYYNENDPGAAAWLRELIKVGVIADGYVDERDIRDVRPSELGGYTQCHFFAGIGVWSYALRLAGWPDDRPVWTGSCPCQPFSTGGKRAGFADERHLWPSWFHLIEECRPGVIFGEQVANALEWIDLVRTDMEGTFYAFWFDVSPAASVGAPHIRQRIYFVAESDSERLERQRLRLLTGQSRSSMPEVGGRGQARNPGVPASIGCQGVGDQSAHTNLVQAGPTNGFWRVADWIACRDGKSRPIEPGTFPLAHGAPARVGRLRGYGNAIVAQQAEAFIRAYMSI